MTKEQRRRIGKAVKQARQDKIKKAIEAAQKVWWEKEKALVMEQVQRAKDEGYGKGYENGVRDATCSLKHEAFQDLGAAWSQVQQAMQAASNYAGIISTMYDGPKAEAKKEEK